MMSFAKTTAVPLLGLPKILRGLVKPPLMVSLVKTAILTAVFFKVVAKSSTAIGNLPLPVGTVSHVILTIIVAVSHREN